MREKMSQLSSQELEVANLIVESLNLEDVTADEIQPEVQLFGDGLGLDSIDILELSLAIKQKYGVQLRSNDEQNQQIFSSLAALTEHIQTNRTDA
jgi:acyl carrier protein